MNSSCVSYERRLKLLWVGKKSKIVFNVVSFHMCPLWKESSIVLIYLWDKCDIYVFNRLMCQLFVDYKKVLKGRWGNCYCRNGALNVFQCIKWMLLLQFTLLICFVTFINIIWSFSLCVVLKCIISVYFKIYPFVGLCCGRNCISYDIYFIIFSIMILHVA